MYMCLICITGERARCVRYIAAVRRMQLFLPLFVLFLVSAVTHGNPTGCNNNLEAYIKLITNKILNNARITCTDVFNRGALSTCPDSYTPTSCTCGMACGSWDIRSDTTCHCQCRNIDWTVARCCKVVPP